MEEAIKSIVDLKVKEVREVLLSVTDGLTENDYKNIIERLVISDELDVSFEQCEEIAKAVFARTQSRLGPLELINDNEKLHEIMVNGPDKIFFETDDGMHELNESFDSVENLEETIRNIAASVRREINEMNPILDARLVDGSRVNAVYKNVAIGGPALTIRKFRRETITLDEMVRYGTITVECKAFLKEMVHYGFNIFISGGTSSGKTTFLNALTGFIGTEERVIIIEDSRELQPAHIDNVVQMECRNANTLGQGKVSMDMLIRTSLRMRPDRIIVGEVRGKEVADMLQAMNTGHAGSMSTGHGNSVVGMLRRLEAMYLMAANIPMDAIRAQIVEGIDILVHLGKTKEGRRMVLEVQELIDYRNGEYKLNPLFLIDDNKQLQSTGNRLVNRSKLQFRGVEYGDKL